MDEAAAISAMFDTFSRHGELPEMDASFDEWIEYNGSDLSGQLVYMSEEDAVAALESGDFNCHGGAAAESALHSELINTGALAKARGEA